MNLLASASQRLFAGLVILGMLSIMNVIHAEPAEADAALEAFFRNYLDESFRLRPLDATRLGDHRFDDRVDDVSAAARQRWLEHQRQMLAELPREIDYRQLSRNSQIDYEMLRQELTRGIWLAENTHPFEEDPRVYGDTVNDSTYSLLLQSTLPRETNVANCLARLPQLPTVLDEARRALKHPPRVVVETAIRQNRGAIAYYDHDLAALAGDSPRRDELQKAARPVVEALRRHQQFLEDELLPQATGDWRLSTEKFSRKLELVLDAGLSADEVLAGAEAEKARVRAEMFTVASRLWPRYFPQTSPPADDERGRAETIARVLAEIGHEHGDPAALVDDARATVDRIRRFITERDVLRLPEPDRCRIIEMPAFRRGNSLAYLDAALPLDPQGTSFYAISPPPADWGPQQVRSFLEEYNRHMLVVLTIHEAYPGHYVQLEYSNRNPSLIRRVLQSGVFIEGWAVYCEQMMLDAGYGADDPALRLSQLKFYLRTVVNAILDHRMHCDGITDDEAFALLTEEAFQSAGEARLKIIRAKQSSVQLSTYFVGRMAMRRLRDEIEREQGTSFNLGRFHEAVLAHGSVPVKYLGELVRRRLNEPR